MFHPSRKGVYCDLCGKEVLIKNNGIEYYTINMKKVVSQENMPSNIEDVLDVEFCSECYSRMRERVLKVSEINNQKREKYARKHSGFNNS